VSKLPWPPPSLPAGSAGHTVVEGSSRVWRVYRAGGRHPVSWNTFRTFGPVANGRFDHQLPPPSDQPDRGILYGALQDAAAAIVEAFQDTRTIDRAHEDPWLVAFELASALAVLDLAGSWPTQAGASQAIATGRRDVARAWGRSIYAAYPDINGLVYPSAMAGGAMNLAIYERGAPALPARPVLNVPLSHPGLARPINRIAATYGYDLR
jgi:hypothetical protein